MIWATGGVGPEVKEYFSRVKPDAKIRYIENTDDLASKLSDVIEDVRWQLAEMELRPLLPSGIIMANIPLAIIGHLKEVDSLKHDQARK